MAQEDELFASDLPGTFSDLFVNYIINSVMHAF